MIELKWSEINEQEFVAGMMKLSRSADLDNKTAYKIGKLMRVCRKEMEKLRDKEHKLAEAYVKPGSPKDGPMKKEFFISPDAELEFYRKYEEIADGTTVTINTKKVSFNKIKGMTPTELVGIECILKDLPNFEDDNDDDSEPNKAALKVVK